MAEVMRRRAGQDPLEEQRRKATQGGEVLRGRVGQYSDPAQSQMGAPAPAQTPAPQTPSPAPAPVDAAPTAQPAAQGVDWARAGRAIYPNQPPDVVEKDLQAEIQAGTPPEAAISKGIEKRRNEVQNEWAMRSKEIESKYQDAQERARAQAEEDRRASTVWRLLGGVGQALAGGNPAQINSYFDELEQAQMEGRLDAAQQERASQLQGLQAERQGELMGREDLTFEQGQEDRQRGLEAEQQQEQTREGAAAVLRQIAEENNLPLPPNATPEAILEVYPFLQKEMERRNAPDPLAEFAAKEQIRSQFRPEPKSFDEEEYRLKKSIDQEFAPEAKKGELTPNAQFSMIQRASKYDKSSRQILQSLDRALEAVEGGAQDIAFLYNFIARMDNTAAREGELDLAQRAQSIMDRFQTQFSNKLQGKLIGPGLREEIKAFLVTNRQQIAEERELELGSLRDLAASSLGDDASVVTQLNRYMDYGRGSTVPGSDLAEGEEPGAEPPAPTRPVPDGMVRVRAPDGSIGIIPQDRVESAVQAGGEVVQ